MGNYVIENFNLEYYLKDCEIITKVVKDLDGYITLKHKELRLAEELTLYLYDSGQATLEYRGREVETFMWDKEAAGLFENFYFVSAFELFETLRSKRWRSIYDERN